MIQQYNSACKYIVAEQSVLGADCGYCKSTCAAQVESLRQIFAAGHMNVDVAGQLLERLHDDTPAFDAAQRRDLAEVVSNAMRAAKPSDASHPLSDKKNQDHPHMYNYLAAGDWDTIRDMNTPFT